MLDEQDVIQMLNFTGEVELAGGIVHNATSRNAAAYFSGYVASKLAKNHLQKYKQRIQDCTKCCSIFTTPDVDVHLFTTFKEYEANVGPG